jgi:hypothetical protein
VQNSHTAEKNLSDWCFGGVRCWRRVRASMRWEIFMKTLLFGGVPLISLLVPLVAEKYLQLVRDAHVSGDLITVKAMRPRGSFVDPPRGRLRADDCGKTGAALARSRT